jgi:hypothetical protein
VEQTLAERVARAGALIKINFHITREHARALRELAARSEYEDVLLRYHARDSQPAKRLAAYLLERAIDDQVRRVESPGGDSSS